MIVIYCLLFYCIVGVLFAIWFVFAKVAKVDEGALHTSLFFKLIIMPATILLWPVVLSKLLNNVK